MESFSPYDMPDEEKPALTPDEQLAIGMRVAVPHEAGRFAGPGRTLVTMVRLRDFPEALFEELLQLN